MVTNAQLHADYAFSVPHPRCLRHGIFATTETATVTTPASNLFIAFAVRDTMASGGNGNREAADVRMETQYGIGGGFYVGLQALGHNLGAGGSGNFFGLGAYVQIDSGSASGTEAVGIESNTDVRTAVVRKVSLQAVDIATSAAEAL